MCVYRFLVDSILITDKPYFCIDANRNRFSWGAEAENLFRPTDPKCDHVIGFDTIREPRRESNRNFENDSAFTEPRCEINVIIIPPSFFFKLLCKLNRVNNTRRSHCFESPTYRTNQYETVKKCWMRTKTGAEAQKHLSF